jgi:hypothetical protein
MTFDEALKIAQSTDKSKLRYEPTLSCLRPNDRTPYYNNYRLFSNISLEFFDKYLPDIEKGKYIIGIATYWGYGKPKFINDNIGLYKVK